MSELDLILHDIDQAFGKKAWHGPNLRGALARVTAEEAAWRPGPGRHNVWELAVHCAYWKYAVWRQLSGAAKGSFPVAGSNFFARPEGATDELAWKADRRLLDTMHRRLREAAAKLTPRKLAVTPAGSKYPARVLLVGIASHDLYHAGQIQLLKRLRQGGEPA
jgi:uncharacterized damage-inducible protein DinB